MKKKSFDHGRATGTFFFFFFFTTRIGDLSLAKKKLIRPRPGRSHRHSGSDLESINSTLKNGGASSITTG